jgi:hypothetical protein
VKPNKNRRPRTETPTEANQTRHRESRDRDDHRRKGPTAATRVKFIEGGRTSEERVIIKHPPFREETQHSSLSCERWPEWQYKSPNIPKLDEKDEAAALMEPLARAINATTESLQNLYSASLAKYLTDDMDNDEGFYD